MGVIDINFSNLKTKHRILGFEAAVSRKTLQYNSKKYKNSKKSPKNSLYLKL